MQAALLRLLARLLLISLAPALGWLIRYLLLRLSSHSNQPQTRKSVGVTKSDPSWSATLCSLCAWTPRPEPRRRPPHCCCCRGSVRFQKIAGHASSVSRIHQTITTHTTSETGPTVKSRPPYHNMVKQQTFLTTMRNVNSPYRPGQAVQQSLGRFISSGSVGETTEREKG